MKNFRIWINQYDMGVYQGINEANALDQYARDAGFESWAETVEDDDEVTVFEDK